MSDGTDKVLKRWLITEEDHGHVIPIKQVTKWHRNAWSKAVEVMPVEDHNLIVIKLKAEVGRYKYLYEDYSSEVEELQHERRQLETTIATQARVIQIAKRVLHNAGLRPPDGGTPTVETICEDLNDAIIEIAAIEKEGAET